MSETSGVEWECVDCHEITGEGALLTAPHPFDPEDTVHGCPNCKGMEFSLICDEPGCMATVSTGTPVANNGYRRTCSRHKPNAVRWTRPRPATGT